MNVTVKKLIGKEYLDKACSFTVNKEVHPNLAAMYRAEHSPIRTQLFWIELYDIPTFTSVHIVRHHEGVSHFVRSNRDDRSDVRIVDRNSPINHAMLVNAQALIFMSRKRLCGKSHPKTVEVMQAILHEVAQIDPDLAVCMVPECEYRGGCKELKSCGFWEQKIKVIK